MTPSAPVTQERRGFRRYDLMKKANINMTRTTETRDGKKGFVIEGNVTGSYSDLLDILA